MSGKTKTASEKAIEIIQWYESIPDDYLDILTMINKQRLLSVYRTHVSKSFGVFKMKYRMAYAKRQIAYNKKLHSLIEGGTSAAAGKPASEALIENERLSEATYEGQAEAAKSFLNSIDKVLDSMRQQVAYLRQEAENDRKYSQGQP